MGIEVHLNSFFVSALYVTEWPFSCLGCFIPRKELQKFGGEKKFRPFHDLNLVSVRQCPSEYT
jgi:hypothetical protein